MKVKVDPDSAGVFFESKSLVEVCWIKSWASGEGCKADAFGEVCVFHGSRTEMEQSNNPYGSTYLLRR